jgi:hypothetical protein
MSPIEFAKRALPLIAATMLAAAVSLPAQAVDCAAPKGIEQSRGCAAAKSGSEALRRYVERTQTIYALYYWDYAPYAKRADVASGGDATTLASAK